MGKHRFFEHTKIIESWLLQGICGLSIATLGAKQALAAGALLPEVGAASALRRVASKAVVPSQMLLQGRHCSSSMHQLDKYTIFKHLVDSFKCVGKLGNATITTGQDSSVITGYPSPSFNVVRFDTKNHASVDRLKKAGTPFIAIPAKSMEAEFEAFAESQAMAKADFVTASVFDDLAHWQYTPNTKVQIRRVSTTDDLLAFDQISSVAFSHPQGLAARFLKPAVLHKELALFVAYINGAAAGGAMISLVNNQAGLYWNGVLPAFRKQGVGSALVEYRMDYAKQLGFSSIVAQNMTPSVRMYQRLGFAQVGGLPLYIG